MDKGECSRVCHHPGKCRVYGLPPRNCNYSCEKVQIDKLNGKIVSRGVFFTKALNRKVQDAITMSLKKKMMGGGDIVADTTKRFFDFIQSNMYLICIHSCVHHTDTFTSICKSTKQLFTHIYAS